MNDIENILIKEGASSRISFVGLVNSFVNPFGNITTKLKQIKPIMKLVINEYFIICLTLDISLAPILTEIRACDDWPIEYEIVWTSKTSCTIIPYIAKYDGPNFPIWLLNRIVMNPIDKSNAKAPNPIIIIFLTILKNQILLNLLKLMDSLK